MANLTTEVKTEIVNGIRDQLAKLERQLERQKNLVRETERAIEAQKAAIASLTK
jgi:capsule polysaccharide export protein KpsE/RkpR